MQGTTQSTAHSPSSIWPLIDDELPRAQFATFDPPHDMLRQALLLACALVRTDALLLGVRPAACAPAVAPRLAPARMMALDVNDPNVAKEFQELQGVDTDDIVDELGTFGIVCPPTMNDMEMRMMLIEVRMRKAGTFKAGQDHGPY